MHQREFEALVRYMMRPPVSLGWLQFTPGSREVLYAPKAGHDDLQPTEVERVDAMEFVARVLVQIPDPRRHLVRYYGAYSNATRGKRKKAAAPSEPRERRDPQEAAATQHPAIVCPRSGEGGRRRMSAFVGAGNASAPLPDRELERRVLRANAHPPIIIKG